MRFKWCVWWNDQDTMLDFVNSFYLYFIYSFFNVTGFFSILPLFFIINSQFTWPSELFSFLVTRRRPLTFIKIFSYKIIRPNLIKLGNNHHATHWGILLKICVPWSRLSTKIVDRVKIEQRGEMQVLFAILKNFMKRKTNRDRNYQQTGSTNKWTCPQL